MPIVGGASASKPAKRLTPPGPHLGGCPVFPAEQRLEPGDRVDAAASAERADHQQDPNHGGGTKLHPDFGENQGYGIPFVVVPATSRWCRSRYDAYGDESDPGPFPIPLNAPIEGGGGGGDSHVLVLQQQTCQLYELFAAQPSQWRLDRRFRRSLRSPDRGTTSDRLDQCRRCRPADPSGSRSLRRGGRRSHRARHTRHVLDRLRPASSCPPPTRVGRLRPDVAGDGHAPAVECELQRQLHSPGSRE